MRRIGLVSTYPPTKCGIATFGSALVNALEDDGHRVDVVCIDDSPSSASMGLPIVARLVNGVSDSIRRSATALGRCDVAIVQHEYGIYGGPDGEDVLALLDAINVPTVVILHTVPLEPTPNQRSILIEICHNADRAVVMTQAAYDRLTELYPVDPSNIRIISHGAAAPTRRPDGQSADAKGLPCWRGCWTAKPEMDISRSPPSVGVAQMNSANTASAQCARTRWERRDGYVPNVVYTCGACAHDDTLILPYGIGDQSISIATLSIKALLAALRPV